jgi:hypothetical protein
MTLEKEVQLNRPGHVTIYANSQAALQAIQNADPLAAQGIFIRIFNAADSLASRGRIARARVCEPQAKRRLNTVYTRPQRTAPTQSDPSKQAQEPASLRRSAATYSVRPSSAYSAYQPDLPPVRRSCGVGREGCCIF